MTTEVTTIERAQQLQPGQAMWIREEGVYAVYLRRLRNGDYAILTGWQVPESYDRDWQSEGAVAGLAGVCHDSWQREYGADLDAALADYEQLKDMAARRRPLRLEMITQPKPARAERGGGDDDLSN